MGDILCGDIMSGRAKHENIPQFHADWLTSLKT